MACAACGRGFHRECEQGCKHCHPKDKESKKSSKIVISSRKSKVKDLKDEKSTGRKRAANLYPIDKENPGPCEWKGLKNCGGGRRPIIGCVNGFQQERHHGPVKKTTRNEEGNVHRICERCHVHWHEMNDLIYNEQEYNSLPHDPVAASDLELMQDELAWKSGEMGKKYELASSKNREKGRAKKLLTD